MTVGEQECWAQGSPFGALKRQRGNFNPCGGADTNTWTTAHLHLQSSGIHVIKNKDYNDGVDMHR